MSWPLKTLEELGTVGRGCSRHRPRDAEHLYGGPYPFIQTGDVKHAGLYLQDYTQTYSEAGLAQSKLWEPGTLCITIAANIADTAILKFSACFPDSIIGFVPRPREADVRFVKYSFDAHLQRIYRGFSQGATQENLSQAKLISVQFPVPNYPEQVAIAELLSSYDDLIENNRRRIQLLEESARLLYREWFVHLRFPGHEHVEVVDGVPEDWGSTNVKEMTGFLSRGIAPKYSDEAPNRVINQRCIRDHLVNLALARRQSKRVPEQKLVRFGDILVNSTGTGTLGRVAQVTRELENCTVDSHVTIVRPLRGIDIFYLGAFFVDNESRIAAMGRGATNQTELAKASLAEMPTLLPPAPLRREYSTIVAPTYRQINNLREQIGKLEKARDLLLPRLMSGALEP